MAAVRVVISGRVQGVGFRAFVERQAHKRGVRGWVRNRRDGTVEAVAQGDDDDVERIVAWCRRGPPAARVATVATEVLDVDPALESFELRKTE